MSGLLCAVFFLSGVSALLFETIWFRQAGLIFGSSVWASTLVLSSYMAGLASGNVLAARFGSRVKRAVRIYAGLELIVAGAGVGLVLLLPQLPWLLAPLFRAAESPAALHALRFLSSFLLLMVPTTAMGATLPILTRALFRGDPRFGRVFGRLYGWNTLGAVVGALSGEAWLIGMAGVVGTGFFAAGLSAVAACGALALARSFDAEPAREARPASLEIRTGAVPLLAAAFLAGAIVLALEVVWFRFLLLFVFGSSLAFAVMLAVVLAGIGSGGLLGGLWMRRSPQAVRWLPQLALVSACAVLLPYAGFDVIADALFQNAMTRETTLYVDRPLSLVALALPLMFPASLLSGVLFAVLGQAAVEPVGGDLRTAALLTFWNTAGSVAGSLLGGFVLLPALGMERSLYLLAGAYAGVALLVLQRSPSSGRLRLPVRAAWAAAAAAFLAVFALFPFGKMERLYLLNPARFYMARGLELVDWRETPSETLVYLRRSFLGKPLEHRMLTDGFGMASDGYGARRYMKLFVYWPVAFHPAPRSALLISYGLGSTAKALTDTRSFETIDVVEISEDVLEMSGIAFPEQGEDPLADPRVRVHVEDGRFFLQTTERRFDLITGEPPPPKSSGVVSLYSREYFELVYDRLNEGGIATYWLPVHLVEPGEARAIIRAFCDAFRHCSLWNGTPWDWMLVGTRGPLPKPSATHLARQWRDPRIVHELRALGLEQPSQLGALFLADAATLRLRTRGVPPLVDDDPHEISPRLADPEHSAGFVRRWTDVGRARARFQRSAQVRRLWPEALEAAALRAFAAQGTLNELLLGGQLDPDVDVVDLHRILTRTKLRAPVLWMLGTHRDQISILDARGARAAPAALRHRLRGIEALADRDYEEAVARLGRAVRAAPGDHRTASLQVFALCMAGRLEAAEEGARELAGRLRPSDRDRAYWARLEELFGLASPLGDNRLDEFQRAPSPGADANNAGAGP